ncbi:hypothetical protein AAHC03_013526 [Spirometra sp. Aus1]
MICTRLHHPSCLFVNPVEGTDGKIQFHLPLFPRHSCDLPVREGRVFASKRDSSEALSSFFERFTKNLNNYFHAVKEKPGSAIHRLQTTQMKLMSNPDSSPKEVKPSLTLKEAFLGSEHELQLRIFCEVCGSGSEPKKHQFHVDVQLFSAWLKSCSLNLLPQVGCPILPALDASNFSLEHSQFQWFVSKPVSSLKDAKWPQEPTSEGLVFVPNPEHVNCFLRLRVLPHDNRARPGIPFGDADCSLFSKVSPPDLPFFSETVTCKKAVTHAPMQVLHHSRFFATKERLSGPGEFRVVSYNLLAFMYSCTEQGRTFFFKHCPPSYLEADYRFPLLYREILAYNADVLCLQEVDTTNYQSYLKPLLGEAAGYDSFHLPKLLVEPPTEPNAPLPKDFPRKAEGVAIFFKRDRFKLVNKLTVDSIINEAEVKYEDLAAQIEHIASSGDLDPGHMYRCRSQGLLACALETLRTSQPHRLVVACTHFFFHPDAYKLRCVQSAFTRRRLAEFATENATAESDSSGNIVPLPTIIGADLNTSPDSLPFQHLVSSLGDPPALTQEGLSTNSTLSPFQSAMTFKADAFTNLVPSFKACIDNILFTNPRGDLTVLRDYPLPTEAEIYAAGKEALQRDSTILRPLCTETEGGLTLPNSQFPSDHLALIVDMKFIPTQKSHKNPN